MSLLTLCHQIRCSFPVVTWNDSSQHVSFSNTDVKLREFKTTRRDLMFILSSAQPRHAPYINTAQKQARD